MLLAELPSVIARLTADALLTVHPGGIIPLRDRALETVAQLDAVRSADFMLWVQISCHVRFATN